MAAARNATRAVVLAPSQCRASDRPAAWARSPWRSERSRFMSLPVSMRTGQAVAHMPSAAQVSTAS